MEKRALATGIVFSGCNYGVILFPPLIHLILKQHGWQLVIWTFGGLILAMVGASMLLKPIDVEIIPKLSEQRWNIDAFYAGSRQSSCGEDEVNEDLETAIQVSNNPLTGMVTNFVQSLDQSIQKIMIEDPAMAHCIFKDLLEILQAQLSLTKIYMKI